MLLEQPDIINYDEIKAIRHALKNNPLKYNTIWGIQYLVFYSKKMTDSEYAKTIMGMIMQREIEKI